MVGSNMLLQIHRRLQQLKGSPHSSTFSNISILAVGDLFQLQPVAQPYVFDEVSDAYARLHGSGSLWMDEFSLIELDQIVRQKGDQSFAQLLCRVRKAECTDVDLDALKAREIEDGALDYPQDAIHVYRLNKDVDQHSMTKLQNLTSLHQLVTITAIDHTKDKHTRQLDMTMPRNKADTGGLVSELHLAVGAKVMLTVNVDVSDGLVNGAMGIVEAIIKTSSQVSLILVKFEHNHVGIKAISHSQYREQYPNTVPISRYEAVFNIGRNKAAKVSRRQFPLVLAWATTIHKVQGLTLDQIVVDMKGKAFTAGQAYVAFRRVTCQRGLFIKNFNPASIKVNSSVISEMERLVTENLLPSLPAPHIVTLPSSGIVKIGHLNVRSYHAKLEDIMNDTCIAHTDVMCFTETYLKPHQHVDSLPLKCGSSLLLRCDRPASQELSNGGVMVACVPDLLPELVHIQHSPSLEVVNILVNHHQICIIAVYRRPQLPLTTFLPLFTDYLRHLPLSDIPTIILGDFNENVLSSSHASLLSRFMSSHGFSQLLTVPTTDQGTLLDHIYYNRSDAQPGVVQVDVVDTYYSDHNACFISIPSCPPPLQSTQS